MKPLPTIMVAPNGARLTTADHPALPVTIADMVATAISCVEAGADGLHAHVRDKDQRHVLDAGLYAELLAELDRAMPDLYVQITTEAVGRYSPDEQMALVEKLWPNSVSIAVREITDGQTDARLRRFFHACSEAGCAVQHILYSLEDIRRLAVLSDEGVLPAGPKQALIVLGRYSANQTSSPDDLIAPQALLAQLVPDVDWAACAFGQQETACLAKATNLGGKVRIGFENNLLHMDGTMARDNAERVTEFVNFCTQLSEITK